jgi:hypothetical protein
MIRAACIKLGLLILTATLLAVPEGRASDPTKAASAVAQKFHVHGGPSLRSWIRRGTYDSVEEACWAAARFRSVEKFPVEVTTSPISSGHRDAIEFRVYVNPCKFWSLRGTVDTEAKALELAEKFRKEGNGVEIVYVFPSK